MLLMRYDPTLPFEEQEQRWERHTCQRVRTSVGQYFRRAHTLVRWLNLALYALIRQEEARVKQLRLLQACMWSNFKVLKPIGIDLLMLELIDVPKNSSFVPAALELTTEGVKSNTTEQHTPSPNQD